MVLIQGSDVQLPSNLYTVDRAILHWQGKYSGGPLANGQEYKYAYNILQGEVFFPDFSSLYTLP